MVQKWTWNCGIIPSVNNCDLVIVASNRDEVIRLALLHAIEIHKHKPDEAGLHDVIVAATNAIEE